MTKVIHPFLLANAERMFRLLLAVNSYPPGAAPSTKWRDMVTALTTEAYHAGIDTIAVSEGSDVT